MNGSRFATPGSLTATLVLLGVILAAVFDAVKATPVVAQTVDRDVTLEAAIEAALETNPTLKATRSRARAARAMERRAGAVFWPTLGLEAGAMRTDDPVGAFGTKLRQNRFTEADFALDALNAPDAVTDLSIGLGANWSVVDPVAWAEREAAEHHAEAAAFGLDRTAEATVFRTRVHFLTARSAAARVAAAVQTLEAAAASADRVRSQRDQGVATEADHLLASAQVQAARADLASAEAEEVDARAVFGLFLGWAPDSLPRPVGMGAFEEPGEPERAKRSPPEARNDLRALERRLLGAEARVGAAERSRLPVLQAYGRLGAHTPEIDVGPEENWTIGVWLSWPVFTGFARGAAIEAARAEREAVETEYAEQLDRAVSEVREAERAVVAARRGLEAAEAALEAATEGRRLMALRFQEGMATTAEMLDADARVAGMQARVIRARTGLAMAQARLDFAIGLPADMER